MANVQQFIESFNIAYEAKHKAYEGDSGARDSPVS